VDDRPVSVLFCNQCGHRNPPESNFCSSCGAPLDVHRDDRTITFRAVDPLQDAPGPDDDIIVNLADLPPDASVLLVRSGPQAGMRMRLNDGVTSLGRHPDSDIYLDDITVSRRHAEVERRNGNYLVRDVSSLNGTYLNQKRVDADMGLANGDEVQVGKFKLVFLVGGAGDGPVSP
jgi:pSer/pThr/pTyr-binding forkhead associated (FHA) protein